IINDRPNPWGGPGPRNLAIYYQDTVIGGPGAFMIPALSFQNFGQAILAKLIREIAGIDGPVRVQAAEDTLDKDDVARRKTTPPG
ncbi:MAG: DUF1194 domain-containing protein, partial [Alphaproteobacteria bacterium]